MLEKLVGLADSVDYVSDRYYKGCMKERNARLVEFAADCCISYWNPQDFRSGTGQTVRMAQKKEIEVINLLEQSAKWNDAQKAEHKHIASLADTKEFTSEHLGKNAMKIRNARLVELASDYCICYWNPKHYRSGTGQTVRMAQKKGIEVINLFESASNSVISPDKRLTDATNSSIMDISNHLEVSTMPRKKKTETAPVAEVKAEVVTEAVKETVAEVPAEKPAKKPAAKKAPAKKTATKAKTPAKAAEKKTTAKTTTKTAAKTTRAIAPVETVKVQFGGDEYDFAEIKKAVEADYKSKFKGKVKTIEFYIKPEDKAVYYVINGDFSDKIEL